jgi:hypothetical protein
MTSKPPQTPLEAALDYYDRGLMPVPVHRVTEIRNGKPVCSCAGRENCASPGKHPTMAWSQFQKRRPPREEVADWWSGDRARYGVGILTGSASGNIFVLDVDVGPGKDGDDSLRALQMAHGDLLDTAEVRTGGGGLHLYFRAPKGVAIRNSARQLGPGLDIRGEGGFVVAPPSVHASGQPYVWSWTNTLAEGIADAPAWLLDLVRAEPAVGPGPRERTASSPPPSSPVGAGSLGVLPPAVEDGREEYMRDTVFAVLLELTGTTGAWPTAEEVFDAARPQLVARLDLSRSGRISAETFDAELATKSRAIVERAHRGALEGARTLEEAVAAYRAKRREQPRQGPENRQQETAAFAFNATPFALRDPATIPRREWIYGRHLVRRFLSVTVAPGGVGKSTLIIGDALALATGKALLGAQVWEGPKRVWLWNLEDPRDEIERRIWAVMQHHHLLGVTGDPSFAKRLFIDSGRDQRLCIARQLRGSGVEVIEPVIEALVAELRRRQIDVLYVDPFVSSHAADENDNRAIDAVAKAWGRVAEQANCAIELVHHSRKLGGASVTQESARGASALVAAARSTRVLNPMTKDEAANAGLRSERGYFSSLDDKRNLAPPTAREWFRLVNVDLANGDAVAAVETWQWPDAFDGLSRADLDRVQQALDGRDLAENSQASDWVGYEIARVLRIDASAPEGLARVKQLLKTWISTGALVVASARNPATRKRRRVVLVGDAAEASAA